MADREIDIVCMGRSSVDLYGEQVGGRLEDMASFAKYVGGCPTNIAIGTARLGLQSALITRVGDEHMGRFIVETLGFEGVDTSQITTDPKRLTALVILGIRDAASIPHIFFRADCADMALVPDHIDPGFVSRAKAVLVTGTHMSRPQVASASHKLIDCARAAGARVVFDIDYRPVLWGLTGHEAGENRFIADDAISQHLQSILGDCDLVVGTEEEVRVAGGSENTRIALNRIRELTKATIVLKRGALGCVAFPGPIPDRIEQGVSAEGYSVEVYNTLGAGDGFLSGFLRGWLTDEALETCCRYGNACGALVVSRHGCAPASPSWPELCEFLAHGASSPRLRNDPRLSHIHRTTTRKRDWPEVCALAFDHRSQLENLAEKHGAGHERISEFKMLVARGARSALPDGALGGAVIDDKYGAAPLAMLTGEKWWLARPVEKPGAVPLEFENGENVALGMRDWPIDHVAKCLIRYHPDDPEELRKAQEHRLAILYEACAATGRELLIEIIPPAGTPEPELAVSRAMQRIYLRGVFPDWWKLPPAQDVETWRHVGSVIEENDRFCRGVLILGMESSEDELKRGFDAAAQLPLCKGFAIGRTIFQGPAEAWFAGQTDDEDTIRQIGANYRRVLELWHARGKT